MAYSIGIPFFVNFSMTLETETENLSIETSKFLKQMGVVGWCEGAG